MVVDTNESQPKFLLVNQPRYALTTDGQKHNGYYTWEFPRGGQQPDETPTECAIRELREETNLTHTTPDQITHMGTAHTDTGILNTTVNYFYIQIDSTNPDIQYTDNEIINHQWVTQTEFLKSITTNQIQDAYTLVAYAKATALGLLPH